MNKAILAYVWITLMSACALTAQTVLTNVQFNGSAVGTTYTGAAVVGTSGDFWNNILINPSTGVALKDAGGAASALTLTYTSSGLATGSSAVSSNGFYTTSYKNLMNGYLFSFSGATNHIIISGLTASTSYVLYLYTEGDSGCTGRRLTVNVNGAGDITTTAAVATASSFILNQNYLVINATTSISGQLDIAYTLSVGEANINGFQIMTTSAIPEPASTAFVLAGSLGLLAFWRRSKAKQKS